MSDLVGALTLLTIIPMPGEWRTSVHAGGRCLAWFPAVGLLLGVVLAVAFSLAHAVFPDLVASALVIALWAGLTGALHLEGLADSGDGLAATASPERRQEIMHDPRVGAFGVVALVVVVICKFAAVASLRNIGFLILSPILARWAIAFAAAFPLARTTGMAALFCSGLGRSQLFFATVCAALAAALFGWHGLIALVSACVVVLLFARLAQRRLGGMNGDVYGAIGEITEAAILILGSLPR